MKSNENTYFTGHLPSFPGSSPGSPVILRNPREIGVLGGFCIKNRVKKSVISLCFLIYLYGKWAYGGRKMTGVDVKWAYGMCKKKFILRPLAYNPPLIINLSHASISQIKFDKILHTNRQPGWLPILSLDFEILSYTFRIIHNLIFSSSVISVFSYISYISPFAFSQFSI